MTAKESMEKYGIIICWFTAHDPIYRSGLMLLQNEKTWDLKDDIINQGSGNNIEIVSAAEARKRLENIPLAYEIWDGNQVYATGADSLTDEQIYDIISKGE